MLPTTPRRTSFVGRALLSLTLLVGFYTLALGVAAFPLSEEVYPVVVDSGQPITIDHA